MFDHIENRQNEIRNNILNSFNDADDMLEKGGKPAQIGEKRMFSGREYVKTADGWKFHGKGTGSKAKEHAEGAAKHGESDGVGDEEKKKMSLSDMKKHIEDKRSGTINGGSDKDDHSGKDSEVESSKENKSEDKEQKKRKVWGETKSGQVIYRSSSSKENKELHDHFTANDHREAADKIPDSSSEHNWHNNQYNKKRSEETLHDFNKPYKLYTSMQYGDSFIDVAKENRPLLDEFMKKKGYDLEKDEMNEKKFVYVKRGGSHAISVRNVNELK